MCRVLRVSRSGDYAWESRPVSNRERRNEELLVVIKEIFEASNRLSGAPRVHAELRLKYHAPVEKKRVARLMRLGGLQARMRG
jgi:transposase InsO family protein